MKRLVLLVVCFIFCFYKVTVSLKPELHTLLSRSEMRKYLDADSHDTVPEYDVIRVTRQRNKRSDHSTHKHFSFSAFGKEMELMLEPNGDVINNEGLSVERRTAGGTLKREIHFPRGRFYVGDVISDPEGYVAVRETDEEKGHLSGAIVSDGHFYQIEPLPDHLHRRAALKGTGHHVITRRSVQNVLNLRKRSIPVTAPGLKQVHKRSKDQREQDAGVINQDGVYSGTVYIEAMLTADKTTCDYYGNETLDYLLSTANLISKLYKDKSIGMNVSWVLVKVFLLEGFDPDLDLATNNILSAGQYLWKYRKWSAARNKPDGTQEHYDQAALLTRRICGLGSCYIDGLAYYNTPCSLNWGVSVNEARGLAAAYTVAHEMGHNIGLPHDSGNCAKAYIMNSVQSSGPNSFHWSPCVRVKLQHIFTSRACFHNKPPKKLPSPTLPPGYINDIDKQCQLAYGKEYRGCPSLRESCGAMYCTKGSSCYSRGAPVAEGTACGYRKWCMQGICSDVGSSLPPPVDGSWGPWGSYGACTRTCGGGVKYRSRKCNNPAPQYFGKHCIGSNKGHFVMCNTQECAVDRFRQEQCEKQNSGSTKYNAYYMGGARKCTLTCVTGNKGYFFGHVKDGTRCTNDRHVHDVCIEGKCYMVGCDKQLGGKVLDRCLNCGGDGSSCVLIKGTYTKNYRVYGAKNGDTMFVIPKGATRVLIRERSKSYNFLSIVSKATGQYYVPVPSWSETFKAAGTSIYHYMNSYNDAEYIVIRGPTNEALQAKYVYSGYHANPGIDYSYYVPGIGRSTQFIWKHKKEGSCSVSCAGGVQLIKVTCHRHDDDSEVTSVYCDDSTKPAESIPCNVHPCPKQFQLGVWSPCSKLCGSGQQHRNLTCVQIVSKDVTNILPVSECAHLPTPATTQECSKIDCFPEWIAGHWSQCSVLCGGGNKTRQVECQKKFGNGTWGVMPADQCSASTIQKPHSSMQCNAVPCYEWRVEYPCRSCGGSNFSYVPIGCFEDDHTGSRPLPQMVGNHRNNIDWHHMSSTVMKCAQDAWNKKYAVFGVQFYGECWSGPLGYKTFDKDGSNLHGCWEGVGKTRNNYVYAFTNLVSMPLVDCIFTVDNKTVAEKKCTSQKPDSQMKLCSDVCM